MTLLRTLPVAAALFTLVSCQKKDCNCVPPPQPDVQPDTWVLDGVPYKATGHGVRSRDGNAYRYTFVTDTPAYNPSWLTLRFNGAPDNTSSFNLASPGNSPDTSTVSITAFRSSDSAMFTSLGTGQSLSAYLNDAFALTWIVNGIWLRGKSDTVRLSFNLSE